MQVHRFRAMGCDVAVAGVDAGEAKAVFERYERTFSRFRVDSELNRVNETRGSVVHVSTLFARALAQALALALETRGLLDPTVGAALEASGYDRDFALLGDDPVPPGPAAPGRWSSLHLLGGMLFRPADVRLDLNGVVKAMAVDEAAAAIESEGFVSAGGDLAVRGPLDVALPENGAVRVIEGGLATSGTTRRRWRRAGIEQHHLIDPATGRPADSCWREVTVSGATCVAADAAAKAAFLLGAGGPEWLDARGLPGRFVYHGGEVLENGSWSRSTREVARCT